MHSPLNAEVFPTVSRIVDRLVDGIKRILEDQLVGVYLYGSLVCGDFEPGISDIDLVVVMRRELSDLSFAALHDLHQQIVADYPAWDNRLELAYISRTALRSFRSRSSTIGIISPGEPFHRIQAGEDWLISWYALRQEGVALQGPAIDSLIDSISLADYLVAIREHVEHFRASAQKDQVKPALAYIVLTVARGSCTLHEGEQISKLKAAAWAKQRYPQWSALIESAIAWRANPNCDDLTTEQIRPLVARYVDDMISRLPE